MRISRKGFSAVITTCLSLSLPAFGQIEEEETIEARFSVYSLGRPEGIMYFDGEKSQPIEFFSSSRSPIYEYEGDGRIFFYREFPAPTAEDPASVGRDLLARANFPETGGDFLMVFFPDPDSEREAYRVYVLPDSRRDLPAGSFRIFNATRWPLFALVDGNRTEVGPGPSEVFDVGSGVFTVGLAFSLGGKVHRGFNSPLRLESGSRGLLFVFPPFVKGSAVLQVRFLNEVLPREYQAPEPKSDDDAA